MKMRMLMQNRSHKYDITINIPTITHKIFKTNSDFHVK